MIGCKAKAVPPGSPPSPSADHSITLNWDQSFANNPACATASTTSCIAGFDEGYVQSDGSDVQLHTDGPSVCAGTTEPEGCTSTFNGTLPIGNVVFYVVTTFNDQTGKAGATAAALSPAVAVGADSATAVVVKIND